MNLYDVIDMKANYWTGFWIGAGVSFLVTSFVWALVLTILTGA